MENILEKDDKSVNVNKLIIKINYLQRQIKQYLDTICVPISNLLGPKNDNFPKQKSPSTSVPTRPQLLANPNHQHLCRIRSPVLAKKPTGPAEQKLPTGEQVVGGSGGGVGQIEAAGAGGGMGWGIVGAD